MLNELLNSESIQIVESVNDWKNAIELAAEPLIEKGFVQREYVNAVYKNIERYGTSFLISPYVILPHARPEQGVKNNSVSILLTRKPFFFENSKEPIKLMILMASTDSKSHLRILRDISEVLNDEKGITQILKTKTVKELYNILSVNES